MNNLEIGLFIKAMRKKRDMTQQELADKIGKTESSIRKYEKGDVEIPISVLKKIGEALNVDMISIISSGNNVCNDNPEIEKLNTQVKVLLSENAYLKSVNEKLNQMIEIQKQLIEQQSASINNVLTNFDKMNSKEGE